MSEPRSIKFLHLITGLSLGGAETVLSRLVFKHNRAGFSHLLIPLAGGTEDPGFYELTEVVGSRHRYSEQQLEVWVFKILL